MDKFCYFFLTFLLLALESITSYKSGCFCLLLAELVKIIMKMNTFAMSKQNYISFL